MPKTNKQKLDKKPTKKKKTNPKQTNKEPPNQSIRYSKKQKRPKKIKKPNLFFSIVVNKKKTKICFLSAVILELHIRYQTHTVCTMETNLVEKMELIRAARVLVKRAVREGEIR